MISLLLPSRKRPKELRRMIDSARDTASGDIEIIVRVDFDDRSYWEGFDGIPFVYGSRTTLSKCWDELARCARGEIVGQLNDDVIFRTRGWDTQVETAFAAYPDHIVLVHGDDKYQGAALGTNPFVHRRWIDIQGFFTPPYFSSDYGDTWNNQIADALGRRVYLPHVVIEHMHFEAGKAKVDETTRDRLKRHEEDNVDDLYWSKIDERVSIANLLGKAMTPPLEREVIVGDLDRRGGSQGKCPSCASKSTVRVDNNKHCNSCGRVWQ